MLGKNIITIENKRYYRAPDVSSYALKRANGKCECCEEDAPFKKDDGSPFWKLTSLHAFYEWR